jgi:hypothetical protein
MKDLIEKWRDQAKSWAYFAEKAEKHMPELAERHQGKANVYLICASELEQKLKQMEDEK